MREERALEKQGNRKTQKERNYHVFHSNLFINFVPWFFSLAAFNKCIQFSLIFFYFLCCEPCSIYSMPLQLSVIMVVVGFSPLIFFLSLHSLKVFIVSSQEMHKINCVISVRSSFVAIDGGIYNVMTTIYTFLPFYLHSPLSFSTRLH